MPRYRNPFLPQGSPYRNPFLPPDAPDEPISDPFGDGSVQRNATMELSDDEDVEETSHFSDGCATCWLKSGFKTKFIAGSAGNTVCAICVGAE